MQYNKNYRARRIKFPKRYIAFGALVITCVTMLASIMVMDYRAKHFPANTTIQGVDCSGLTVEEAKIAISEAISQKSITLVFSNDERTVQESEFGIEIIGTEELELILDNSDQKREHHLEASLTFSEEKLRETLKQIPELQEQNMKPAQNAFIKVEDDGTLAIEKEVIGTEIDFDEAVEYCIRGIINGQETIDFRQIMNVEPEILSTDENLNEQVRQVNSVLATVIEFKLNDGSKCVLDKSTTRNWVCTDDSQNYYVDFNQIETFVKEELVERAEAVTDYAMFYPTGYTEPIRLPGDIKVRVDVQKEMEQIAQELRESGKHSREPFYKNVILMSDEESYIEISIARQKVWLYYKGECILETDCVTGNVSKGYDTPTGVYYLDYKVTDQELLGRYHVDYWMPFFGNYGLHDAYTWRSTYGGDIYLTNGSHGCVNLPLAAAKTIYEHIDTTMPIIIY